MSTGPAASQYPAGYKPEPVPTAEVLARMGLARPISAIIVKPDGSTREDTRMWISPEGHDLMGKVMARNAAAWRAAREATS